MKTKLSVLAFLLIPTLGFSASWNISGGPYQYIGRVGENFGGGIIIGSDNKKFGPYVANGKYESSQIFKDSKIVVYYFYTPATCSSTDSSAQPFSPTETLCNTGCSKPSTFNTSTRECVAPSLPADGGMGTCSTSNSKKTECLNRLCSYDDAVGTCYSSDLSDFSGNRAGCESHGGYYLKDKSCNKGSAAIKKVLSDPNVVVGAGLMFNGLLWTSAGMALLPETVGGSSAGVSYGLHAMALGLGSIMLGIDGQIDFSSSDDAPLSATATTPEGMKVKLIDNPNGSSSIVKSNPTTGKVTDISQISQATKDAFNQAQIALLSSEGSGYIEQLKANTTDAPIAMPSPPPVTLAGTESTSIDYATNTATTVTNTPSSTVANPSTTTSRAPVTVSQNSDGTVTTTKMDPTGQFVDSWTVTGFDGGYIKYTNNTPAETSSTGTTGTGDGKDYTGVLNSINSNTGSTNAKLSTTNSILDTLSSKLQSIKDFFTGMFTNSVKVDSSSLKDGSDGFDGLGDQAKNSFSGFVYTDPLGLNSIQSSGIGTYGFTLWGHSYVILDQSMIDKLPLSLIRNLLLFIAALLGLITVVSGV